VVRTGWGNLDQPIRGGLESPSEKKSGEEEKRLPQPFPKKVDPSYLEGSRRPRKTPDSATAKRPPAERGEGRHLQG